MGWTLGIFGSLLNFSPVDNSWVLFILSDSLEHVVFVENTDETQKSKLVLHFVIESRIDSQSMEENVLLVFGESYVCQHNGLSTSLNLTLWNQFSHAALLESNGGSS